MPPCDALVIGLSPSIVSIIGQSRPKYPAGRDRFMRAETETPGLAVNPVLAMFGPEKRSFPSQRNTCHYHLIFHVRYRAETCCAAPFEVLVFLHGLQALAYKAFRKFQ